MMDTEYPPHIVQLLIQIYRKLKEKSLIAGITRDWFGIESCQTKMHDITLLIQHRDRNDNEGSTERI